MAVVRCRHFLILPAFLLLMAGEKTLGQQPFRVLYDFHLPKVNVFGTLREEAPVVAPVINDQDQVAFVTSRSAGGFGSILTQAYRTTNASRSVISSRTRTPGAFPQLPSSGSTLDQVSINNSGDVAFSVLDFSSGNRQFSLFQDGVTTPVGTFGTQSSMSAQSLNDLDQFVFKESSNATSVRRALLWENGSTTVLFGGADVPVPILLNNDGMLAMGNEGMGSPNPLPLYLQHATDPLNNIAEVGVNYTALSLNQSGQLLVNRQIRGSSAEPLVYVMSLAGPPEFVLDPIGISYARAGSINDLGAVAFATLGESAVYFFAPGDLAPTRILGFGDPFRASTVSGIRLSADAINNRNRIAFSYELADDTNGVLVVAVPEASSWMMAGFVMIICLATRIGGQRASV